MKLKLTITTKSATESLELSGALTYTIGRKNASVVLKDERCSAVHALFFEAAEKHLCLKDLNSTNGTFLNGKRVRESSVSLGDEIRIGATTLSVQAYTSEGTSKDGTQANVVLAPGKKKAA